MKERPILFSAPMVRAILDGTKTMTRRIIKPQPTHFNPAGTPRRVVPNGGPSESICCPYGQPGDRLWVRETYFAWGRWETRFSAKKGRDEWHFIDMTLESGRSYAYDTDEDTPMLVKRRSTMVPLWWRRPAIFMPRAASRILLEITDVRVERLQDISEDDARAEGIERGKDFPGWYRGPLDGDSAGLAEAGRHFKIPTAFPKLAFRALWESINGPKSWAANLWVWVVEFRRVETTEVKP